VLFAGQPSCSDFVAMRGVDVRVGAYVTVPADCATPLIHSHAARY
jgi:hypothetical protein